MKRQGFHRWEVKNGAHKLLLWWSSVNNVVQQRMTETKSDNIHPPSFMCMYVFVFKTYCSRVAQTHYYPGTNLYSRVSFVTFCFVLRQKRKAISDEKRENQPAQFNKCHC